MSGWGVSLRQRTGGKNDIVFSIERLSTLVSKDFSFAVDEPSDDEDALLDVLESVGKAFEEYDPEERVVDMIRCGVTPDVNGAPSLSAMLDESRHVKGYMARLYRILVEKIRGKENVPLDYSELRKDHFDALGEIVAVLAGWPDEILANILKEPHLRTDGYLLAAAALDEARKLMLSCSTDKEWEEGHVRADEISYVHKMIKFL